MSDLEKLEDMLTRANIDHEVDSKTYPGKIVIRVREFSYAHNKDVIKAIFDFDLNGNLLGVA